LRHENTIKSRKGLKLRKKITGSIFSSSPYFIYFIARGTILRDLPGVQLLKELLVTAAAVAFSSLISPGILKPWLFLLSRITILATVAL
jgi:hypothetical protein